MRRASEPTIPSDALLLNVNTQILLQFFFFFFNFSFELVRFTSAGILVKKTKKISDSRKERKSTEDFN